jgi:hypothetical protein
LFPFATNTAGFDTGLSIANTTATPFETLHQSGKCDIFFYGSGAPSSPFPTPTIPAGTVYTNLISNIAPNFQGYLIVTCTFGGASGMGFVSDVGARNLFSAYIAPILPTPAQ